MYIWRLFGKSIWIESQNNTKIWKIKFHAIFLLKKLESKRYMKSESRSSIIKRKPSAKKNAFPKVSLKNRDVPSYEMDWIWEKVRFYPNIWNTLFHFFSFSVLHWKEDYNAHVLLKFATIFASWSMIPRQTYKGIN